jgi:hypothetical protein
MVVTPSTSQSHPTLHIPSTEPHHAPVLNVRRPKSFRTEAGTVEDEDFILAAVVDDTPLPPTVLRLPNLATSQYTARSTRSIASIAHWVAIVLGGLLAMALIFGGRRGAMPDPQAAPLDSPARAEASPSAPAWVPPPLDSAGDSTAPAWKPPAAAAPPTSEASQVPAPPADPPLQHTPEQNAPHEAQQEAWPRPSGDAAPASTPELPAAGTSAHAAPPIGGAGPVARTAQLEAHLDPAGNDPAASEAQSLGITVPVPQ